MASAREIICPICQATASFCLTKNDYRHYRCSDCALLFVYPLPSATANIYADDYFAGAKKGFGYVDYDQDKAAMRDIFVSYLNELKVLAGDVGRIFDIGAATGYFLGLAKELGWSVSGLEISDYAAGVARAKGIDVSTGIISDVTNSDKPFDVVTMWDVIEHVKEPLADLKKIHSLLRPGGVLAINTPNSGSLFARILGSRWHLLVPPEHLHYFTVKSLTKALEQTGFGVVTIKYPGKVFTVEYIIHTLARWQNLILWKKFAVWLEHYPRLARLGVPINLRDNVLVYAVKR